jgi:hypothetical protein
MAGIGLVLMLDCTSASWTDTFRGVDHRSAIDAGTVPDDEGGVLGCMGSVMVGPPVTPITVTFPGHGTESATIHIVAGTSSCDLTVDTDEDGVVFVSDATPCVALLAGGTPSESTATASGSPTDLLFQWTYGSICTLDDDYTLSAQ